MRGRTFLAAAMVAVFASVGASAEGTGSETTGDSVAPMQRRVLPVRPGDPALATYTNAIVQMDVQGALTAYATLMNGPKTRTGWKANRTALLNKVLPIVDVARRKTYPGSDAGLKFIDAQLREKAVWSLRYIKDNPTYNEAVYRGIGTTLTVVRDHRDGLLYYLKGQCAPKGPDPEGCGCPARNVPNLLACQPYHDRWSA